MSCSFRVILKQITTTLKCALNDLSGAITLYCANIFLETFFWNFPWSCPFGKT